MREQKTTVRVEGCYSVSAQASAGQEVHLAQGRQGIKSVLILLAALSGTAYAAANHAAAEEVVKNQPCKAGETVDQLLDRELKPSHRDLGWRVFARDDGFDVERAFLASKSMELRYRWRVGSSGQGSPVSERAQKLCS